MEVTRNPHELPTDRLATTDVRGRRIYLYPADVRGRYRARRSIVNAVLLAVFLALPWLKINGHPAVLLDIPNRRFALFGLLFWAHEAPMLVFVAGGAILSLAFVTAVWGRIWCGWACPQTVFVDGVFRRIERWIEGDALTRRRLDEAPWSAGKLARKGAKWGVFGAAALVISHSFLAYFVGPEELGRMIRSSPSESPAAFACMLGMFALVLFDFGWFREQFCTVVCPYGRFQSVLMDDISQVVAYDAARGEPRRGVAAAGKPAGDCVNCYRCVQVCPTGIDIRRGLQLECVACTACIDACDEVMRRTKKPEGLIRYTKGRGVSARGWVYAAILLALMTGLTLTLARRRPVSLEIVRAAEAPYQELEGGRVINHFKLDLANQSFEDLSVSFAASEVNLVVSNHAPILAAGVAERADLFVQYPKTLLRNGKASLRVRMRAQAKGGGEVQASESEVSLVGPYR